MSGRGLLLLALAGLSLSAQALEDPTRPSGALFITEAGIENNGLQLTSTLVSEGRRIAIINGKTVRQGDTVGSATVLKIQPTEVIVLQGGERKSLALLPSDVKKDKR